MTTKSMVTIYWYTQILTDKIVKFNKSGLVIWNATEHTVQLIDVTVPQYYNMVSATANKITKYNDLKIEKQNSGICKRLLL